MYLLNQMTRQALAAVLDSLVRTTKPSGRVSAIKPRGPAKSTDRGSFTISLLCVESEQMRRIAPTVYYAIAAAMSLNEVSMGVGCQRSTSNVARLSKEAAFPMNGSIPFASRSKKPMSFSRMVGAFRDGTLP